MKIFRGILASITLMLVALAMLHLRPALVFSYKIEHGQFTIWSDRPIETGWDIVINDTVRRLETSELYDTETPFRIFVCNDTWRLWIFTRNVSVGGFTDTFTTRNIFLREVEVENNQLVPPHGSLADAHVRPLSYFIAHEATHVMQSNNFGRLFSLRSPRWLVEGYADLIAKAGDFDVEENLQFFKADKAIISENYARHGLYRRYHLMTEHVISNSGQTIRQIFASPPQESTVLLELKQASKDSN